jgi:hypothetical protein
MGGIWEFRNTATAIAEFLAKEEIRELIFTVEETGRKAR